MRRHPLLDVLQRIDPEQTYTVKDIAELVGVARGTAGRWASGGHLGEGGTDRVGAYEAGIRRVWTGRQLLSAVTAPRPVQDHGEARPSTTWSKGCRAGDDCDCIAHHNSETSTRKRLIAEGRFPDRARAKLLKQLAAGGRLAEVIAAAGLTQQALWARARVDDQFRTALDAALMAGRSSEISHGQEYSYRVHKCRCPECRVAKAAYR